LITGTAPDLVSVGARHGERLAGKAWLGPSRAGVRRCAVVVGRAAGHTPGAHRRRCGDRPRLPSGSLEPAPPRMHTPRKNGYAPTASGHTFPHTPEPW